MLSVQRMAYSPFCRHWRESIEPDEPLSTRDIDFPVPGSFIMCESLATVSERRLEFHLLRSIWGNFHLHLRGRASQKIPQETCSSRLWVYYGYPPRLPGGVAYTLGIVRCNLKCDEELESLRSKLISLRTNWWIDYLLVMIVDSHINVSWYLLDSASTY